MDTSQSKQQSSSSLAPDSVLDSSPPHSDGNAGEHISLSSPVLSLGNSPAGSCSSPFHSEHNSGGHISLSPTLVSLRNSPARSSLASDHATINLSHGSSPENEKPPSPEKKPPPPVVRRDVFMEPMENRIVVEEPLAVVNRVVLEESADVDNKPVSKEPKAVVTEADPGVGDGGGNGRRRFRPSLSILRRAKRDKMVIKAALGFRIFGFLFCLVSLSVMAADRNQGWALDSFERYKEFRYCMSVNVIGFLYSGAQAFDLTYNLATGKYIVHRHQQFRYYFDFAVDQMIAYLLISASSSAVIRVDDWQSNWGKDKFPDMATASVSMSFLAFVALASSSLISGYALCKSRSL